MASNRNYVSTTEVDTYTDNAFVCTDEMINKAEEIIDGYVGYQEKFYDYELFGQAAGGSANTITLQLKEQNLHEQDFFKYCYVEIVSGVGAGQRRIVSSSTKAGVLTVQSNWTTAPTSESYYKIYQLGKFPRIEDVSYFSDSTPYIYLKSIPEAVKRAVAAQVEYMQAMGAGFFKSNKSTLDSESIGDYSYSRGSNGVSSVHTLIAPKAKEYLSGIRNRTGFM
ncbi:MAG: hypothetical protein MOGMAGMI_01796 [Candidatus Omnitrophica bacterium]|nr:hypothetical protein [Candidatus Omnitrophota bacterium]